MRTEDVAIDYDFHRIHAHQLRREAIHAFFRRLIQGLRRKTRSGIEMDLFHPRSALPRA